MQMNRDSVSVQNRVHLLQTPRHNPLPLPPAGRAPTPVRKGSSLVLREAIRRGDSWEETAWLLIGFSALAGLALALGI